MPRGRRGREGEREREREGDYSYGRAKWSGRLTRPRCLEEEEIGGEGREGRPTDRETEGCACVHIYIYTYAYLLTYVHTHTHTHLVSELSGFRSRPGVFIARPRLDNFLSRRPRSSFVFLQRSQ